MNRWALLFLLLAGCECHAGATIIKEGDRHTCLEAKRVTTKILPSGSVLVVCQCSTDAPVSEEAADASRAAR